MPRVDLRHALPHFGTTYLQQAWPERFIGQPIPIAGLYLRKALVTKPGITPILGATLPVRCWPIVGAAKSRC